MVLDKPIKVMLVDDDPSIHESLRDVVEEVGYEFCSALSGREGLRLLDEERPDLLLLDVMMPGMNGFDVCRQIREEGRRIPIIFLTAKNDIVDKSTGFGAGADDYVTKPFIADELLLRIDAHVRRHRDDMRHVRRAEETDGMPPHRPSCRVGDLEILFDRYEVRLRGEVVPLTAKEFEILSLLADCGERPPRWTRTPSRCSCEKFARKSRTTPVSPAICLPSGVSATSWQRIDTHALAALLSSSK